MTTLRLERFDATSNASVVMGRFETNDIEKDIFRRDAVIMDKVDPCTDVKAFDLDQGLDWLDNPDNSLRIVASGDNVTFVLHQENNTNAERRRCHSTDNE